MPKITDITGSKYNHLTALKYVGPGKYGASIWAYRCDCGNEKDLASKVVTAGRTKTCGKCELKRELKVAAGNKQGPINWRVQALYQQMVRASNELGKKWAISMEHFSRLIRSNCSLCGSRPSTHLKGTRLLYNKVVLIDIHKGYTEENIGCLCTKCARPFSKLGISYAIDRAYAITAHLSK